MAGEYLPTSLVGVSVDVSYGYTESASSERIGPHFLRITDIQNGTVNWKTVPYCPISAKEHGKYRLEKGDIVIARTGNSTGENYLFKGAEDAVFASYLIRFRLDTAKAFPLFVWYNLRTSDWWNFINNSKTGSAQAGANAKLLGQFPLILPPLPVQQRIANILGSLDDKIELNRKMNETLESMAKAIFKSWFVDFDPVVAKSEGRQPEGMDAETAKLFPDSFEESEIGRIPKGWKTGTINDLITLSRDTIIPMQSPDEVFDHYSIPAFDEGRAPKTEQGNTIMSNKFTVHDNCVLLSKLNPRISRVWMPESLGNKRALCSTEFLVSMPKKNVSKEYLYLLYTSAHFCERFATFVTGTSGSHQRVKPESLLTIETPLPSEKLTTVFTSFVSPLLLAVEANSKQIRSLAEMRNSLLPRLLSGELTVSAMKVG